jgi:DNA primase catalytic core
MAELERDTGRIRDASNIVEVVAQYVRLRKSGPQMIGLCPFHKEKNPSFTVHPAKGLFKCFGCGEGGDVFRFVQLIEGVDFKRARTILADRAGVNTSERPLTREQKREYSRKKARAEREAEEFLAWLDGLVEALREHRDVYFRNFHRMRRYIQRLRETDDHSMERLAVAVDVANTCWARVEDLDRAIERIRSADLAKVLPLFRARKTTRKAAAA